MEKGTLTWTKHHELKGMGKEKKTNGLGVEAKDDKAFFGEALGSYL